MKQYCNREALCDEWSVDSCIRCPAAPLPSAYIVAICTSISTRRFASRSFFEDILTYTRSVKDKRISFTTTRKKVTKRTCSACSHFVYESARNRYLGTSPRADEGMHLCVQRRPFPINAGNLIMGHLPIRIANTPSDEAAEDMEEKAPCRRVFFFFSRAAQCQPRCAVKRLLVLSLALQRWMDEEATRGVERER